MRYRFQVQPARQLTPSEKLRLPLKSRDELPSSRAGWQGIWRPPTLKAELCARRAAKIRAGQPAPGRPGLDLWQILVLGGVRLGIGGRCTTCVSRI